MNPWRPFPLIRLLIPAIAGIATGLFIRKDLHIPLFVFLILLFFLIFPVFVKRKTLFYQYRWLTGALIIFVLLLLVYENTIRENDLFDQDYFVKYTNEKQFYIGDLVEPVVQKQKTTKTIINIVAVNSNGIWRSAKGKALVYIQKDSRSEQLFYGDRILFFVEFTEPKSAAFPYSFDQKRFLRNQNIYYTSYIGAVYWKTIPDKAHQDLLRIALTLRNRLLMILRDNQVQGREFAVTAALLLGYVDELDQGLLKDYSATGAMHILSVSGMHVGIIFLVLDKILGFLRKTKYGLYIKTILIIFMVWFYAMLTGLSPAVLRASVMISLVAVGKAMKRQPDILNILSASFILLLIREPTLLVNVGFQLSYLAVAGIVLLYKPVYDLYITSNTIIDKIWSIIAVSIAAQIITFPLSLYYFHQFPNYFMITNILVVPLSTLIIYCGILLLILGSVPFVSFFIAKILITLVWLLNHSIHFIEEWPYAVTRGVYINIGQTICIYLTLLTLFLFLFYKKKLFLFLLLLFSIGISGSVFYQKVHQFKSRKILVYGVGNFPVFDFVSGETSILLADPKLHDNVYFDENLKSSCSAMGIKNSLRLTSPSGKRNLHVFAFHGCFYEKGNFIQFHNKRIGFIDKTFPPGINRKIHVDYLIITGNPKVTIEQIRKVFIADAIIVDPSNSPWRSKAWKQEAVKERVTFHDVNETGVFEIDF